jgi:hypothetical protein
MTDTLKVLAQAAPSPTVLTTLYTVPGATSTTVSSITVCNQNSSAIAAFRVSIAIGAAADSPEQYLYYDVPLIENDTFIAVVGLTLAATDVIRVQTSIANVSFGLFGVEVQ